MFDPATHSIWLGAFNEPWVTRIEIRLERIVERVGHRYVSHCRPRAEAGSRNETQIPHGPDGRKGMLQELSVVEQRYLAVEEVLDGANQVAAVNLRDRLRLCIPEAAIGPSSRL